MTCCNCIHFKLTRGLHDRYGLQLEPDDAECTGNASEEEIDRYFCDAEDGAEHCSGFKSRNKEDYV